MRNALVIGMDESLEVIDLDAPEGSLKVLQNAVDGYIEQISLNSNLTMYVNEEGKINGYMTNSIATAIFQARFGMVDIIVGNAVLTGSNEKGLTEEQLQQLQFMFS